MVTLSTQRETHSVLNKPTQHKRAGTNHCYTLSHHEWPATEQAAQVEHSRAWSTSFRKINECLQHKAVLERQSAVFTTGFPILVTFSLTYGSTICDHILTLNRQHLIRKSYSPHSVRFGFLHIFQIYFIRSSSELLLRKREVYCSAHFHDINSVKAARFRFILCPIASLISNTKEIEQGLECFFFFLNFTLYHSR